jgi:hypothetical protein
MKPCQVDRASPPDRVRASPSNSAPGVRQGVRDQMPFGNHRLAVVFRPEDVDVAVQLYHGGLTIGSRCTMRVTSPRGYLTAN